MQPKDPNLSQLSQNARKKLRALSMAASSTFLNSAAFSCLPYHHNRQHKPSVHSLSPLIPLQFHLLRTFPALQASRRATSGSYPEENHRLVNESRKWSRFDFDGYEDDDDDDDEEDDEEEDRSLDLLARFVENIFRKVSKRARRAVRSVLPVAISTKLVGFAVNGLIILAFLWVLKAFLEVVCTFGSVVFVSILLIRGVWSGVVYLQERHSRHINGIDDDYPAWTGAQPIT